MSRRFARFALAALVALAVLPAVRAGKVYRWVDAKGVVHYGDHVPQDAATAPARVDVVPVSAEPTAIATLRTQASGHGFQAIAENRLAGPRLVGPLRTRTSRRERRKARAQEA